jgi:hypothetical protein
MSAYIKHTERSQINHLMLSLKLLERQKQGKSKGSRRQVIKIMAKINEIQTTKSVQRINEAKAGSLKK